MTVHAGSVGLWWLLEESLWVNPQSGKTYHFSVAPGLTNDKSLNCRLVLRVAPVPGSDGSIPDVLQIRLRRILGNWFFFMESRGVGSLCPFLKYVWGFFHYYLFSETQPQVVQAGLEFTLWLKWPWIPDPASASEAGIRPVAPCILLCRCGNLSLKTTSNGPGFCNQ